MTDGHFFDVAFYDRASPKKKGMQKGSSVIRSTTGSKNRLKIKKLTDVTPAELRGVQRQGEVCLFARDE